MTTLETELIAEVERLQDELENVVLMLETTQQDNEKLRQNLMQLSGMYTDLERDYSKNLEQLRANLKEFSSDKE